MEFNGNELLLIVANQGTPIQVMDGSGRLEAFFENPVCVLPFLAAGGYVGIGHNKRIRYLRPADPEEARIPWGSIFEMGLVRMEDRRRGYPKGNCQYNRKAHHARVQPPKVLTQGEIAERLDTARFYVKRDPLKPWSEDNGRPVF